LVVVVITMIGLVSLGGAGVMAVLIGFLPTPGNQATVLADTVRPASGQTLNRTQVQITLNALLNLGLRPGAIHGSPLLAIIPWSVINRRALVADAHGTVVGATQSADFARNCPYLAAGARLPAPIWNHFLQEALAGRSAEEAIPIRLLCGDGTGGQRYAEAPIRNAAGQPIGMAVVQGGRFLPTTQELVSVLVVGVTAATLVLLVVAVLPTLAVSTLVSYVFARGITRRLEAVSQAASALANGDLSQRAPLNTRNEIGRLAEDFNRMANRMEATMTELRLARTQAESALRAREELVAGVSHELRTPIAVVRAHLESLQMRVGAEAGQPIPVPEDTLEALHHEMERLTDMVDDLFSLARAGAGALPIRVEPTDVAALVREQGELLRPLVRQHGAITLSVEVGPGLPPALADGDRLRQILANLVRNAARHTPEGGIIALAAGVEDQWVVITVADTGEGIAPEHLPRIFEPFYRADPARSRAAGGAGLGLSIVNEFVQLMGGHVTASSTVGEGSCFRVYLPPATQPASAANTVERFPE
jgi:signal transduction histidine kinase